MKWISAKDRTPEYGKKVLVYDPTTTFPIRVGYVGPSDRYISKGATHWMPLPDAPEEKNCHCCCCSRRNR